MFNEIINGIMGTMATAHGYYKYYSKPNSIFCRS